MKDFDVLTAIEIDPDADYGDLMTIEEFTICCDQGGFIDDDGFGHLATFDQESNVAIHPSERMKTLSQHPWATHILWFNN